jgi:hypothetical protein
MRRAEHQHHDGPTRQGYPNLAVVAGLQGGRVDPSHTVRPDGVGRRQKVSVTSASTSATPGSWRSRAAASVLRSGTELAAYGM